MGTSNNLEAPLFSIYLLRLLLEPELEERPPPLLEPELLVPLLETEPELLVLLELLLLPTLELDAPELLFDELLRVELPELRFPLPEFVFTREPDEFDEPERLELSELLV
jgi:hypothetical protein